MKTMNDKTNQLAQLLKRLNDGENPASVRAEAKELISQLNPAELSLAEQQLVDEGLPEEHLRGLCSVHMEMLEGELDRFKASLPVGHVVRTMVEEHEMILSFLDQLEDLNRKLQSQHEYHDDDLKRLVQVAENLIGAEPHHEREEKVLFTEMEQREVSGPPRIMRMEHEDLRPMKKQVRKLGQAALERTIPVAKFKAALDDVESKLVFTLRDHIFKENNILYPTALEVIADKSMWADMKQRCDQIGYCSFTPKQ